MNRRRYENPWSKKLRVQLILVLLVLGALLYANSPSPPLHSRMLELNSTILAESTFEILSPSPFVVQRGNDRSPNRVQYRLIANSQLQLTISSANASSNGTMRLKHNSVGTEFMPYQMYLDYAGLGAQNESVVTNLVPRMMEGFNDGYDHTGTFSFLVPDNDTALAGSYSDTITFTFTHP